MTGSEISTISQVQSNSMKWKPNIFYSHSQYTRNRMITIIVLGPEAWILLTLVHWSRMFIFRIIIRYPIFNSYCEHNMIMLIMGQHFGRKMQSYNGNMAQTLFICYQDWLFPSNQSLAEVTFEHCLLVLILWQFSHVWALPFMARNKTRQSRMWSPNRDLSGIYGYP